MKLSPNLIDHAAEALATVMRFEYPADGVMSRYFRAHEKLGQQDRAFIAETVFAVLRRKRLLDYLLGDTGARDMILACLAVLRGHNLRELESVCTPPELEKLGAIKQRAHEALPFEIECDLPDWVIEKLRAGGYSDEALLALARSLQRPAPLDLRVNLSKTSREDALAVLTSSGVEGAAMSYSPAGIRLKEKPALSRHSLYVEGAIEVQDEGSQLLCYLLGPKRGEMVVDFCAGAGGKTLGLGMLMRSTGRLYAFDISTSRLTKLKPRLARSGLSNVHPQHIDSERDPRIGRLVGKIDRVLIDAPCSGMGTLRRNPDLKWRQTAAGVDELAAKQTRILESAARLLKPGGQLVYATCSILAEENERVVEDFLSRHPEFKLVPAVAELVRRDIALPENADAGPYLKLAPDSHQTDGFFAALLEKVKVASVKVAS